MFGSHLSVFALLSAPQFSEYGVHGDYYFVLSVLFDFHFIKIIYKCSSLLNQSVPREFTSQNYLVPPIPMSPFLNFSQVHD